LARQADTTGASLEVTSVWPSLAKAALLLVALVSAAWLLRPLGAGLLHAVRPSWGGAALLIGAGGAMTAIGVPRQVLAFTGGYVFGAPIGAGLSLAGQVLGCVLDYVAARALAAGLLQTLLARPAARRMHLFLAGNPFTATLTLRLLPVSSNVMLNLAAGASRLNPPAFFMATVLGYTPQTIVFALIGSGTQVGKGVQLSVGVMLFGAAALLGVGLYRRRQAKAGGDVPSPPDPPSFI
jgi:uncharacterized membrane protein YdjX (TVP38/TMEM64 family)